ncbi:MAG: hypothetical protein QOC61_2092 [Acidobacteriota bacterium]|jgi:hypothetical protein|nr:hypothetical protein [Acidobacteriota bacterium]MDT5263088.1 hypothetical protein [Acidobacteriota bacterium]MDT7779043.1 hypothetical protein [Acidobacteriota bacterium]
MKSAITKTFVRFTTTFVVVAAALAATTLAAVPVQDTGAALGRLRLDSLERLAPKATETVNIEIDGFLIKFAGSILSDKDADERAVKEIITGLKGVYVRSYEFKAEGAFSDVDIAGIREQLRGPGWSRIIDVKSLGVEFDDDEVYVATSGGRIEGLALLVIEPKEVTVINLVGSIDIDKLKKLEGSLGIPRIHIEHRREGARRGGAGKKEQ